MTQTARSRLLDIYGTAPEKVFVIPHGAADHRALPGRRSPAADRRPAHGADLGAARTGQGDRARDRLDRPASRARARRMDYQVAGQTHPRVRARRRGLPAGAAGRARARGVGDRVHFDDRFLPGATLSQLIGTADVVLLPYDSLEQVTSGVLIEAVTAGKPVVSTCFPHAVELLGAGLLVERQDPAGIAHALHRGCSPSRGCRRG
jgi:hypothetical protein